MQYPEATCRRQSGLGSSERLIPVITLCVYWGIEPWTGPRNLHEMLDIPDELVHYKHVIGNYPLNLLEVCAIENLEDYSGELKALLGFLKFQKDKKALKNFVEENRGLFQSMTLETAQAIAVLGNAGALNRYLKEFDSEEKNCGDGKEGIDMCQALQEMMEDSRKEGIEQGMEIGIRMLIEDNLEEGISEERILEKLQRRFHMTEEKAGGYLDAFRK